MRLWMALLASVLFLPVVAEAQSVQGFYINVDTGLNLTDSMLSSKATTKIDTNLGPLGLVDLGWGFGDGLRAEIEGSYRSNEISGISTRRVNGTLQPLGNASGSEATYAAMANVVYDIPIHPFELPIYPYVGAGLGYGWLDFGSGGGIGYGTIPLPQNNRYTGPLTVEFGSAGAFAYQTMVGAAMPLGFLPRLDVTLEYRFSAWHAPMFL